MHKITGTYRWQGEADWKSFAFESDTLDELDEAVLLHIIRREDPDHMPILRLIKDQARDDRPPIQSPSEFLKRIQEERGIADVAYQVDGQPHLSGL